MYRLAQINLHLHNLEADIVFSDTLWRDPSSIQYDVCLTNPPFGIKGDLSAPHYSALAIPTNNKQLGFLQHVYSGLKLRGRAAIVVPDNVLFESGAAASIRSYLLDNFDLHTILRLPSGIFYATGVKTSVLFFARTQPTRFVWIYDLRREGSFTKKRPLEFQNLQHFVDCYGTDPYGHSERIESETFRFHSRESLRSFGDRLDIGESFRATYRITRLQPP